MNVFQLINKFIFLICCYCTICFFSGCVTTTSKPQSLCNILPSTSNTPPDWITGNSYIQGFYVGIGQAERKQGMAAEEVIRNAKAVALGNLSENIKVEVNSQFEMSTIQNENDYKSSFFNTIRHDLTTQSNLTMYNIQKDALWLDTEKCIVWMRIKLKKALVKNLFMISQAESYYKMAKNMELPVFQRIRHIDKSITIIKSVDFSNMQLHETGEMYLKKYKNLHTELVTKNTGQKLIYFVQAPDFIQQTLNSDLAGRLISHHPWLPAWYDKNITCKTLPDCMDMARINNSQLMIYVQIKTSTTKQDLGIVEGGLHIVLSLYDVTTKKKLFQHITNNLKKLSLDIKQIPWNKMIDKLFTTHSFDTFLEYLREGKF